MARGVVDKGQDTRLALRTRVTRWTETTRGLPRNVYLLLLFTLGKGVQLSIGQVTISLYAYSVGYKQDFVGLLVAVPAIGALLAAIPIGFLADRIPRKPLLLITGMLNPVALALIGLTTTAPLMLAASFANGVLSSAYWVTIIPMLTDAVEPRRRVSVMSFNSFLLLGVGALGGLLGGAIPEWVGALTGMAATAPVPLRWGVVAAAIAVLLPTIPLFWLTPLSQRDAPTQPDTLAATPENGLSSAATVEATESVPADHVIRPSLRPIPLLFVLLLVPDILYTAGEGAVVALEPLFFRLNFHISPALIGALVAAGGLLVGITALLAPSFVRRYGKLRVITLAQALSAPIALAIGYAPWFWLSAIAELLRNLLRGAFDPVYATFAMERVNARYRARLSAFYSLTWSIGFSAGAAASGWLQRNINLSIGFLLGATLLGIAPLWLTLAFGRDPNVD
ncbi:MAG TPA: MFS transporter [Ktedonobacterales bacterium]|nr:MFS transporter [Ktedonobacterales bacterium]